MKELKENKDCSRSTADAERLLAAIVESSEDAIIGKTLDGTITAWNRGAQEIYGYTAEEAIGRSVTFLAPPERADDLRAILEKIRLGERVARYETVRVRKDGTRIDVALTVSPIRDADGKIVGASTMARDITEDRRGAEELHRSRELLRLILDNIPARVFWKDRGSRYLGCNSAFARDTGRGNPSELVGRTDDDLPWRAAADGYRADDARVMEAGRPMLGYEERARTADGVERWVRTSKVPLHDGEGRVTGVLGTYEDITRRKEEELMMQTKILQVEKLNDILMDREHRIVEMKAEVNKLLEELGRMRRYAV